MENVWFSIYSTSTFALYLYSSFGGILFLIHSRHLSLSDENPPWPVTLHIVQTSIVLLCVSVSAGRFSRCDDRRARTRVESTHGAAEGIFLDAGRPAQETEIASIESQGLRFAKAANRIPFRAHPLTTSRQQGELNRQFQASESEALVYSNVTDYDYVVTARFELQVYDYFYGTLYDYATGLLIITRADRGSCNAQYMTITVIISKSKNAVKNI
ncbi:hypothetical protein EV127DRAFT_414209 [Xylaria flabelliformis]|nr:hypothetical protein EV127DRAFT_414209 [Xylaria flabelliformis]